MFVRRKPNKTGSVSVQVIDKSKGRYHVIKSFGTGELEAELLALEKQARTFIRQKQGLSRGLFDEEEQNIRTFVTGLSNSQLQVIGTELIFGTLYDWIGYNKIEDKANMFRHLVITRLFNPGSKLKTIDYLLRYQGISYHRDKIYRFLDNLCYREKTYKQRDIKTEVESITFSHTKKIVSGKIDVVFYDMTTLYFETSEEDDLRKTGFSKDGKPQCPQIFLGLLVASGGNPIGYEIFEGNIFEGNSLIPLIQRMEKRYELEHPIVIADSGLLSKKNIDTLTENGYEYIYIYILGARPKSESEKVKSEIMDLNLQYDEIAVIRKSEICRLIISKTEKRAKKDAHNRKRGLSRLEKNIASGKLTKSCINNKGYNKYLRMEGYLSISIDMQKYESDAIWDGIKGYLTNTKLSEKDVIDNYRNLWYIERAFYGKYILM
jgi:transposase